MSDAETAGMIERHLTICPKCSAAEQRSDAWMRNQFATLNLRLPSLSHITLNEEVQTLIKKMRQEKGRV